ncbi:hypothetical protein BH23ACT5_BH23ACT5_12150 [soil metagenome]
MDQVEGKSALRLRRREDNGRVGVDHASILEPVDGVHGLAVEIPGPTAASAVLAVVGIRPQFLASEVARIERLLVGRLHPLEPVLSAPIR